MGQEVRERSGHRSGRVVGFDRLLGRVLVQEKGVLGAHSLKEEYLEEIPPRG